MLLPRLLDQQKSPRTPRVPRLRCLAPTFFRRLLPPLIAAFAGCRQAAIAAIESDRSRPTAGPSRLLSVPRKELCDGETERRGSRPARDGQEQGSGDVHGRLARSEEHT